jgi:hypothetical protein
MNSHISYELASARSIELRRSANEGRWGAKRLGRLAGDRPDVRHPRGWQFPRLRAA